MKLNKIHFSLLTFIIIFWIITAISPLNRYDWLMENILFIVFFFGLLFTYKKFQFSDISYFLITLFFTLHLTGAHYTYSEVPLGFWLRDVFDLSRNHFDRIVHFAFGLLLTYPTYELLSRTSKINDSLKIYLVLNIMTAWSSFFEIIEWLFVLKISPELREAYLGMQGDIWDAQKDIGLGMLGAIISLTIIFFRKKS